MKKWIIRVVNLKKLKTTRERKFHKFQNYDIRYYFFPSVFIKVFANPK